MRLPERGEHPAARNPDKAAGDHIAEEMVVGADQADRDSGDRKRVKRAPSRIIDPQYRDHRASDGGVAGGERCIGVPAMEEIEAVGAVAQERRVVISERVGPGAAEHELEMDLGQFRDDQAQAAEKRAILQARKGTARQVHQPEDDENDDGERHHRIGRVSERCEGFGTRHRVVEKQRDRPVEPLVRNSGRDRGSGKAKCPFLQRIHRLVDYHIFRALAGGLLNER
jgi:hypothetical protein